MTSCIPILYKPLSKGIVLTKFWVNMFNYRSKLCWNSEKFKWLNMNQSTCILYSLMYIHHNFFLIIRTPFCFRRTTWGCDSNAVLHLHVIKITPDQDIGLGSRCFNVTFNNISVISWRSNFLVEETGVPGENHWHATSYWQTLSHNVVLSTSLLSGIQTHNRVAQWVR